MYFYLIKHSQLVTKHKTSLKQFVLLLAVCSCSNNNYCTILCHLLTRCKLHNSAEVLLVYTNRFYGWLINLISSFQNATQKKYFACIEQYVET